MTTPTSQLASVREIEIEEDQAQRLERLRERFGDILRSEGLISLLDAQPGDSPLPGVVVVESGEGCVWWMMESE